MNKKYRIISIAILTLILALTGCGSSAQSSAQGDTENNEQTGTQGENAGGGYAGIEVESPE